MNTRYKVGDVVVVDREALLVPCDERYLQNKLVIVAINCFSNEYNCNEYEVQIEGQGEDSLLIFWEPELQYTKDIQII